VEVTGGHDRINLQGTSKGSGCYKTHI